MRRHGAVGSARSFSGCDRLFGAGRCDRRAPRFYYLRVRVREWGERDLPGCKHRRGPGVQSTASGSVGDGRGRGAEARRLRLLQLAGGRCRSRPSRPHTGAAHLGRHAGRARGSQRFTGVVRKPGVRIGHCAVTKIEPSSPHWCGSSGYVFLRCSARPIEHRRTRLRRTRRDRKRARAGYRVLRVEAAQVILDLRSAHRQDRGGRCSAMKP